LHHYDCEIDYKFDFSQISTTNVMRTFTFEQEIQVISRLLRKDIIIIILEGKGMARPYLLRRIIIVQILR